VPVTAATAATLEVLPDQQISWCDRALMPSSLAVRRLAPDRTSDDRSGEHDATRQNPKRKKNQKKNVYAVSVPGA
jgi:hypothetical protein